MSLSFRSLKAFSSFRAASFARRDEEMPGNVFFEPCLIFASLGVTGGKCQLESLSRKNDKPVFLSRFRELSPAACWISFHNAPVICSGGGRARRCHSCFVRAFADSVCDCPWNGRACRGGTDSGGGALAGRLPLSSCCTSTSPLVSFSSAFLSTRTVWCGGSASFTRQRPEATSLRSTTPVRPEMRERPSTWPICTAWPLCSAMALDVSF